MDKKDRKYFDWLIGRVPESRKFASKKFRNSDSNFLESAKIYFPDFVGGKMYKEDHTISLPEFGYYWRKFKNFLKKPFQKMIDKRHRLKHYDAVCKENEKLKKINEGLEHEIWRKGVYLDEAYRLLKNAKKE